MTSIGAETAFIGPIETPTRDPQLAELLTRLEKEDRLFLYNVPTNIRTRYNDDDLQDYLRKTYTQPYFVVEDPDDIDDFAISGDRVIKKGNLEHTVLQLPQGTHGVVGLYASGNPYIQFEKYGHVNVDCRLLKIYGRIFEFPFLKDSHYQPELTVTNKSELKQGHKVCYDGPDLVAYEDHIPDAAQGIITKKIEKEDALNDYCIIFANQPGLQQSLLHTFSPADFRLIIPNTVPFQKLVREHIDSDPS